MIWLIVNTLLVVITKSFCQQRSWTISTVRLVNNFCLGFLFGYEEELACLGQIMDSEAGQEEDFWDEEEEDDFFFRRRKRSVPDYRDPVSGKCMWGVLRDLNNTEHETVR